MSAFLSKRSLPLLDTDVLVVLPDVQLSQYFPAMEKVATLRMRNFLVSRGTVAGILKGYVGFSAAVVTEVYTMVLKGSASMLLLSFTLGIPVICLALMYYVRPCTPSLRSRPIRKRPFSFHSVSECPSCSLSVSNYDIKRCCESKSSFILHLYSNYGGSFNGPTCNSDQNDFISF